MDSETLNAMYRMIGETRYFIHDFNIHVGKVTAVRKEHEKFLVSICDGETEQEHQVSLSDIENTPVGLGHEFPFYLPTSWEDLLKEIFDRGRAAGVQIVIIRNR